MNTYHVVMSKEMPDGSVLSGKSLMVAPTPEQAKQFAVLHNAGWTPVCAVKLFAGSPAD